MNAPAQALQADMTTEKETKTHDPSPFECAGRVLIGRGVPVVPLRPGTKIAFQPDWPRLASTDLKQIIEWGEMYPEANIASVAKATLDGVWFFEIDKPGLQKVIQEETGQKFPQTFAVRSSPGKGHFYLKQTPFSIQMGNRQGKDSNGKEAWSARVDDRYVVGPGSIHPKTLQPYMVVADVPLAPAPDWLVEWCIKNDSSESEGRVNASPDGPPIPHGQHDRELFRIACMLRNAGMDYQQILDNLIPICEKRCVAHGDDYVDMCENKAKSAMKYEVGKASAIAIIGGSQNAGNPFTGVVPFTAAATVVEEIEYPEIPVVPYPVFPDWVMGGTSVYEGLVKPICDANSRYPEFMFLPAYVAMLNYLNGKVSIKDKSTPLSIFLVMIGRKGRVFKSSSMNDAIKYMETAGIVAEGAHVKNSDGKTLTFQPASPEGLGKEMARTNCKNVLMVYDELSALTNKMGIESSALASQLRTLAESGYFSNTKSNKKDQYAFPAKSYCASLIACTTETDFSEQWAQIANKNSGIDERFYFLLQPETLVPVSLEKTINTVEGAIKTGRLIAKAVNQGVYEIEDPTWLEMNIAELGVRGESRAEKFALAFAIDLGKTEIDDDCLSRGIDLARYEKAVKRWLGGNDEAVDKLASAQNKFCRMLQRQPNGMMSQFAAERGMNHNRYSTEFWWRIVNGLVKSQRISILPGRRKDSTMIRLLQVMEFEE